MLTLYDVLRATGVSSAIGWTSASGHADQLSTWGAGLVAAAVSIGAAWAATIATKRIARTNSEALLWVAYLGTFTVIPVGGAAAGVACHHLLESI